MPEPIQVVIDTNVFIAMLRSRTGAASKLFSLLPDSRWQSNISPALFCEYEEQGKRVASQIGYSFEEIEELLDAIADRSNLRYREIERKPRSADPDDDFILDLAAEAGVHYIITHNVRDFRHANLEGIEVIKPGDFLRKLNEL